jgi:superfamily II DNA/RNA helicase
MSTTFAQLGVPDSITRALEARGIIEPFAIQAATITDALDGRDICGRAPTGSGKTLAFGIPLVATVERAEPRRPRALVLAPTRELAEQICIELRTFAGKVRIGAIYGGVGYGPQLKALRDGVEILVACPGRLEDLLDQGALKLDAVTQVVLDEADRMADMGFMPAVRRLLDKTAEQRQTVLFSATLDGDVAKLTRDHQTNPIRHEVGDETPDITAATHVFWTVDRNERVEVTAEAIGAAWPAIIFCRTRHGADRLAKQLARNEIRAAAIHGGRSQNQRTRALADFMGGRVHALVATDVAARGIHVDGVASVVHYDPPEDHKAYQHRSGRTARAGKNGVVISLVQPEQRKDIRRLQRDIGIDEPVGAPDLDRIRELSPPAVASPAILAPYSPTESAPEQGRRHEGRGRQGAQRRGGSGGRGRDNGSAGNRNRSGQSQGNGQGNSQGNGNGNGNGNSQGNGQGRPAGNRNRSGQGNSQGRPGGNRNRSGQGSSQGNGQGNSQGNGQGNGQGNSQGNGQGRPGGNRSRRPNRQSRPAA